MKIIVASANKGKIKEIKHNIPSVDIIPYFDLIDQFEIVEDALTFRENAIKKAEQVYARVKGFLDKTDFVLADDSGICVDVLQGFPGVFSARYASLDKADSLHQNCDSKDNLQTLIDNMHKKSASSSKAHYSVVLALIDFNSKLTTFDGVLNGKVIDTLRGANGFGYDPIFIPDGFDVTLGELEFKKKQTLSHRYKALCKMSEYVNGLEL